MAFELISSTSPKSARETEFLHGLKDWVALLNEQSNPSIGNLFIATDTASIEDGYKLASQENGKLIYTFLQSTAVSNYSLDITKPDSIAIFNDSNLNIHFPYPNISGLFNMPVREYIPDQSTKDIDILVHTDEAIAPGSALVKILRALNRLTNRKIVVYTECLHLAQLANPHIQFTCTGSLFNLVERSRMIIGSGYAALYGILAKLPVIVVGERGYGGIPTNKNIQLHFNGFFQGAIGGRMDGPIPEPLLLDDVKAIFNSTVSPLQTYIVDFCCTARNQFKQFIYKHTERNRDYAFNNDYTIIRSSNDYWLLSRYTRQIKGLIDPKTANNLISGKASNVPECYKHIPKITLNKT